MTTHSSIIEFLRVRLDEDERLAQAGRVEGRALGKVEAKRLIISRCERLLARQATSSDLDWADDFSAYDVLTLLAVTYDGHPGYDPGWVPVE